MTATLALVLACLLIGWAGWCIAKKGYAAAALLIVGILMLIIAAVLGTEPGLLGKGGLA
ncbi:MAG: hypothetical protein HUK26_03800, partial [Duodenibacillus sp.]|nr:hypothetical protein [Duodenibacillus sp.]